MMRTVQIYAEGSDWSEAGTSQAPSQAGVDCSVEVQVVVQQQPAKSEAAAPEAPAPPQRKRRSKLRCCGITLLVLGLLATGVLVPIAFTVGFRKDIPPEFRVLQPPRPSNRLVFAFQSSSLAATARDVLPEHLASQVDAWSALPSSGIHVASFATADAMQQALAHLSGTSSTPPARHLLQDSSRSTWALKYAVTDFRLLTDRQVTQVVDPMQLFDLAKQQSRVLLEQQQKHGSRTWLADADAEEDAYLSSLEGQQQDAGLQQRRQRLRSAAAAMAASATDTPRTAQQQQQPEDQQRRHLASAGQQQVHAVQHDGSMLEADMAAELLPESVRYPAGATSAAVPAAETLGSFILQEVLYPPGGHHSGGRSSASGSLRRRLLQAAAAAVPRRSRPQLQVQQRQAQQQVQRGGNMVAWHLADAGLGVRGAWNITSGLDRVIVAVIDTGVELASSGVGAAVWANAAEVAGDGVDNDGNGYADDAMGWDFGGACGDITCSFCAPGPDPTDTVGWGTHAAAAVAAQPEVASGTAGIAPGVRIMPLKVADCRDGTQLWDVATQQGNLVKDLDTSTDSSSSGGPLRNAQTQQGSAGPTLLGSAAVQALDYAVLNGAHIVLAGWTAGELLGGGGSSAGQCFLGADAATQQGVDAAAAAGGAGCVAAVQHQLFHDALKPLQDAGVLVVTMQDSSSSAAGSAQAGAAGSAPLPCSLSCELDNVVCVGASTTLLPPVDTAAGRTNVVSASDFFSPLISQHSSSYYDWLDPADLEEEWRGMGSDSGSGGSSGSSSDSGTDGSLFPSLEEQEAKASDIAIKQAALSCSGRSSGSRSGSGDWAQLGAPGRDILAGWAWGSHAVVSGSSAAASVTAGVAALAWSKLSQTLGADASAAAFEGLGQLVKQQLLQGSSVTARGSSSAGAGASSSDSTSASAFVPVGVTGSDAGSDTKRSSLMDSTSSDSAAAVAPAEVSLDLDLFGTLQQSARAPEVVALQPAVLSDSTTAAVKSLRYSWHIQGDDTGPYDTNAMWFVGRKVIKPQAFPITRWEFYGSTSLVEVAGYLEVPAPGSYEFAVSSEDRFVLWLQDWWLHMQEAGDDATGLPSGSWTTRVNFAARGLYKLRIIVYAPGKPFNLQWKPPSSSTFSSIPSYVSVGQAQPLPQQLLHSMLLPLSARADSSRESSSKPPPAPPSSAQGKPPAPDTTASKTTGSSSAASTETYVAGRSTSTGPSANPAPLPEAPGGDSNAGGADVAATGVTSSAASPAGRSSAHSAGSAPGTAWDGMTQEQADADSMVASMEPAASSGNEPMLAADAQADIPQDSGSGAGYADGGVYQMTGPAYTPITGAADSGSAAGGDDFWSALQGIFGGGGWFGRRRLMMDAGPRRSLPHVASLTLAAGTSSSQSQHSSRAVIQQTPQVQAVQQQQQQVQQVHPLQQPQAQELQSLQQPQRRLATAAIKRAPVPRRVQEASGSSSTGAAAGRFSLALAFAAKTQFRTLMPDPTKLVFTHTGVLPGAGLNVGGWLQLQENVLGYSDPKDNRGAYGMIQGWLDWRDLNPLAAAALSAAGTAAEQPAANPSSSSSSGGGNARSGNSIAVEGAGLGVLVGGSMLVGAAGVQFEVSCDSCSLQIDGMTVVGSLGPAETSSCVVSAAAALAPAFSSADSRGGKQQKQQQHLLHLLMLFTTNDVRNAKVNVRARPCTGLNSQAGAGAWAPLKAATGVSHPAFAVPSTSISGGHAEGRASGVYARGMLCSVTAQPPAVVADAAAGGNASSSTAAGGTSGGEVLHCMVFLSAERMQEAISIPADLTTDVAAMPPSDAETLSSSNSSSATVDAPGFEAEGIQAGGISSSVSSSDSANSTTAGDAGTDGLNATGSGNSTAEALAAAAAAQAAADAAARRAEAQRRAAQTAAAKAAALARGVGVSDLVPDWVATLPGETHYSITCGCYWNGSWEGNVSVAVKAAGSRGSMLAAGSGGLSGHARMFLAGWPVAARAGQVLGPSDLDVRGYSTLMQRQQLAAGSDSADPLVDAAHSWAVGLGLHDGESVTSSGTRASGVDGEGGSSSSTLTAEGVRRRRHARVQQQAVSRTSGGSSSGGSSGSSSVLGLQPLGVVDGVSRREVMAMAGQHQLLVLQAEGLTGEAQVVVLAPGDPSTSSNSSSILAAGGSNGGSSSSVASSWLPGPWEAWVPAG